jgi:hypothetical protein
VDFEGFSEFHFVAALSGSGTRFTPAKELTRWVEVPDA